MISAYEIGAKLVLDDTIGKQLGGIYDQFNVIQQAIERTNNFLRDTVSIVRDAAGAARGMANAFQAAATAAERIQRASAGGFGGGGGGGGGYGVPGGGGGAGEPVRPGYQLPRQYPALTYDPLYNWHAPQGSPGVPALIPGQGRSTSGAGANMPGYNPGAYVPNWTPGSPPPGTDASFHGGGGGGIPPLNLNGRPGGGGGGGSGADPLNSYFLGRMIADGAWQAVSAPYNAAAGVAQTELMLTANGMTKAQAAQAYSNAVTMQQNPAYKTLSVGDILGIDQMAYLQTKDIGTTQQLMPQLAAAAVVMQGLGDSNVAKQVQYLMRSADLSGVLNAKDKNGKIDPTRSLKFMQDFISVEMATGDALSPDQFMHFYQNAGPAVFGLSDQGRQASMLVAYSLGQQKAGTGLGQLTKELIGGKMSIGTEKYLESIGLLDPSKVVKGSARGGYVQMKQGALKDEALFLADPTTWIAKQIGTAVSTDSPAQFQDLIHKTYAAASTAQAARYIGESLFQYPMIQRQLAGAAAIPGLPQLALQFSNTPTGTAKGAANTTNALLVTLGQDIMGPMQAFLNLYTKTGNTLNNSARQHPAGADAILADVAAFTTWIATKAWSKWGLFGRATAGAGAGAVADLATGPAGIIAVLSQAIAAALKDDYDAGGNKRQVRGRFGMVPVSGVPNAPDGSMNHPIHTITTITNGVTLVSSHGPTAPNGPTAVNRATTAPNPGANNRLQGHQ